MASNRPSFQAKMLEVLSLCASVSLRLGAKEMPRGIIV
jgi:hypothetical protein